MKKVVALVLCILMIVSITAVCIIAESTAYEQPFDKGMLNSECYRIPALYTLNNGSVMAVSDMRYGHGSDAPNNIDIAIAVSKDGYSDWDYNVINYFDDYADGVTSADSASFIDSAIVQSSTGRIFVISDAYPSGGGYLDTKKGTGYIEIGGKKHLLLTTGNNDDKLSSFDYYVGDYEDEFAPVLTRDNSQISEYTVDREFRLYKNGEAIYLNQKGSNEIKVQQNIFYNDSDLCCYKTAYLWMRYSDNNGKNWSAPVILSPQVKSEKEDFLGIAPGRGTVINYNGKERIIFCIYDNNGLITDPISENASTIYSDDNGITWHRSDEVYNRLGLVKTSEAQIVEIKQGENQKLRMLARNSSNYIAYADSFDGGYTWTTFCADETLEGTKNCMSSFINTSKKIDEKDVVLSSSGGNVKSRADGVIRVGVVEALGKINWINKYNINKGFFGYSCMTELSDGNFAILYEDEAAHLQYMIFSVSDDGEVSRIDGDDIVFEESLSFLEKVEKFLRRFLMKILFKYNLI